MVCFKNTLVFDFLSNSEDSTSSPQVHVGFIQVMSVTMLAVLSTLNIQHMATWLGKPTSRKTPLVFWSLRHALGTVSTSGSHLWRALV